MSAPSDALLAIIAGQDTTGLIEVRCRRPSDGKITARDWFPVANRDACSRFIAAKAPKLDVYVGVAPRTRREGGKAAIDRSWLLYLDCDTAEAAERVGAFTPRPSLIVRSGTGDNCHAYWSLTEPLSPAWFERANRRLAHHIGADMVVTDAARILRPPGTLNHKHTPPTEVTAESFSNSPVSVAHLVGHLPDPPTFRPVRQVRPSVHDDTDPLLGISADLYYTTLTGRPVTRGNVQCPFHGDGQERNPSMRLYETTWYCFGCAVGGSVYEFAARLWGYLLPVRGADFVEIKGRLMDAFA